jgi:hypothetical protein
VSDHPHLKYSPTAIANAGKVISGDIPVSGDQVPIQVREAFLVANNWRDAQAPDGFPGDDSLPQAHFVGQQEPAV